MSSILLPTRESRFVSGLEMRAARADAKSSIGVLAGYALTYGTWSQDLGGFREKIRAGAVKRSLEKRLDVRALAHHDSRQVLARQSAGTLRLVDDAKGLAFELDVPDTTAGRDTKVSVDRGDLTGMSFEFSTISDEWSHRTEDSKKIYERELVEIDVWEISVVTWPAYQDTSVEARAASVGAFAAAKARMDASEKGPGLTAVRRAQLELERLTLR